MIVSGSEINTFNECQMRWMYQFELGLMHKDQSIAIQRGNSGHDCMEMFFKAIQRGLSKKEALDEIGLSKKADTLEIATLAATLAHNYASHFNVDSGKPIYVEDSFKYQLNEEGDKIGFSPDMIWQYKSGKIRVYDWKFSDRSWPAEATELHYQLPSYKWWLQEMLGIEIDSVCYVYIKQSADGPTYKEHVIEFTNEEAAAVAEDQLKAVEQIIEFKEAPLAWTRQEIRRINNIFICTYCPFKFPCRLSRKGMHKKESEVLAFEYTENTYGYKDLP